jgi:hypothetical protein
MDDLNKRGQQDRSRINVNEEHELQYWSETLNISREELKEIVGRVGVNAEDVREAVKSRS